MTVNILNPQDGSNNYQDVIGDYFSGQIAQLWWGYTQPEYAYSGTIKDRYTLTRETVKDYVDLESTYMIGSSGGFGQYYATHWWKPIYFNSFAASGGTLNNNISKPITATFTLITQGDRTKFVESALSANFSAQASALRVQFVQTAISAKASLSAAASIIRNGILATASQASLSATTYDFTKAQSAVTAMVSTSSRALRIFDGVEFSLGKFTFTADGQNNGDGAANLQAKATVIANGLLKVYVRATAALTARFTITAQPRASFRSSAAIMANFNITPTDYRVRYAASDLVWQAFTIEAGRIISIDRDYVIPVAQETGLFWADDVSSPYILVAGENGVNIVSPDTAIISVEQETGLVLAQHI